MLRAAVRTTHMMVRTCSIDTKERTGPWAGRYTPADGDPSHQVAYRPRELPY